jgi:phosphoribosylanthranilate isomerase
LSARSGGDPGSALRTRASSAASSPGSGVRVKICGVTSAADARLAIGAGADMIGLNFFAGSKRAVDVERAREIGDAIGDSAGRVGVFVNATRDEIAAIVDALELDAIQLHGDEPPELARGWDVPVIRALHLAAAEDAERALERETAQFFLCEGATGPAYGGVGAGFDWSFARPIPPSRLIVAGGLSPENVARAVRELRPFAVDVASGVESSPGRKDAAKVAAFIEHAKAA